MQKGKSMTARSNDFTPGLCSVIIPAFNCEKYIGAALRSALGQTYNNIEIIVIDDCSTDKTRDIIRSFDDGRIRLLDVEKNSGAAASRNLGLDSAAGEFIAFLDADDIWSRDKLEKQISSIRKGGAKITYCSYGFCDESGKRTGKDFIVPTCCDFETMLFRSLISMSTGVVRRDAVGDIRFSGEVYHEDLLFWLRLLKKNGPALGIVEPLALYRQRPGSRSSDKIRSARERYKIFKHLSIPFYKRIWYIMRYSYYACKKYH